MKIVDFLKNNSASLLTGAAIAGVIETAIFSISATPKAIRILDELDIDFKEKPIEAVDAVWKCYIPAITSCGCAIICIIGAHYSHIRKEASLIAACSYLESKHSEYVNAIGYEKDEEVQKKIISDRMESRPIDDPKDGLMWCYEPESNQFFQATTEKILWAELTANKMFLNQGYLTFNQFLNLLPGCKKVPWGNHFGWYIYDEDGCWDYNWSYYKGTPWIDVQPQLNVDGDTLILAYGMHPGDDLDCKDLDEPEQFVES